MLAIQERLKHSSQSRFILLNLIDLEYWAASFKDSASVANAFGSAIFVTSDNPGAHASLLEFGDAFVHVILQLVLDPSCSKQDQVLLKDLVVEILYLVDRDVELIQVHWLVGEDKRTHAFFRKFFRVFHRKLVNFALSVRDKGEDRAVGTLAEHENLAQGVCDHYSHHPSRGVKINDTE